MTGNLHENLSTSYMYVSIFVLRMRNIPDKNCRENKNIHLIYFRFVSSCIIVQFK